MKKVILVIGLCIAFLPTTSEAQLKGLKKNLEKAKNSITGNSGTTKKLELDFDSKSRMPAVAWYSLLEGVRLSLDGKLTMAKGLDVYFLPDQTTSGKKVNFRSNYIHEIVLWADVIDMATQENSGTLHFIAYDHNVGHPKTTIEQKVGTGQDEFTDFVQLKEGTYELRFFAGGTHYYTFPFEVIKKSSENAYAAMSELYFLKGDNLWSDYAYMRFTYDESHNQNVLTEFVFYIENEDTNVKNASYPEEEIPAEYNAIIKKEDQLIGTQYWGANGEAQYKPALMDGDSKRGVWVKVARSMDCYPRLNRRADKNRPQLVSIEADLSDGNYTIEVSIKRKDQPMEKRIFPFTVQGGKIQSLAETQNKDSKRVLEQGPEIIFLKRAK